MNLYLKIRDYVMEKHPDIMSDYNEWIIANGNNSLSRKIRAYMYLAKLFLHKKDGNKKIIEGEGADCTRMNEDEIIQKILKYDVISFDVFDTLILRNVERPEDIFSIVGSKLNISGFAMIRQKVERKLWEREEYNIYDIYKELSCVCGVDEQSFNVEFAIESAVCRDNPYIKKIYQAAVEAGKTVIATSDMYWPKEYIEKLLIQCGYTNLEYIFVSCDIKKSKYSGEMFRCLKQEKFKEKKIIHIGDNYNSDICQAKKVGIDAIQYPSVYEQGRKYRVSGREKKAVGVSVANAIINNEIHNGMFLKDKYEEYGFIYGGILIAGYCNFINMVASEKRIEKLFFVARDANVIHKAYTQYYEKIENEYVYASRNAVAQLAFERYPDFFIEQVLRLRFIEKNKKTTVGEVLKQTGLQCLAERLDEAGLREDGVFDKKEMESLETLIYKYKTDIVKAFENIRKGAYLYWKKVIGNKKRIALVDIGWQGSTMVCLQYFLNEVCDFSVDLYTIQLGTLRTKWNEQEMDNGRLISYCFSSDFNKKLCDMFSYDVVRKNIAEIIFTAPHPTLVSYGVDENGQGIPIFAVNIKENANMVEKMQQGIMKFVEEFYKVESKIGQEFQIPGEKAFQPLFEVSLSKGYVYDLFKDYTFSNVPNDISKDKMGNIMKKNNYK